jgi:hypothetical protein
MKELVDVHIPEANVIKLIVYTLHSPTLAVPRNLGLASRMA